MRRGREVSRAPAPKWRSMGITGGAPAEDIKLAKDDLLLRSRSGRDLECSSSPCCCGSSGVKGPRSKVDKSGGGAGGEKGLRKSIPDTRSSELALAFTGSKVLEARYCLAERPSRAVLPALLDQLRRQPSRDSERRPPVLADVRDSMPSRRVLQAAYSYLALSVCSFVQSPVGKVDLLRRTFLCAR